MSTFITDREGDIAEILPLDWNKYALIHPKFSRATIVSHSVIMHIIASGGFITHENGMEC